MYGKFLVPTNWEAITFMFYQPTGGLGVQDVWGDVAMVLYWEMNSLYSAKRQWPESSESSTRCPIYFGMRVCQKLQREGSERTVASLLQAVLEMWDFICTWVWQLSSAKSMGWTVLSASQRNEPSAFQCHWMLSLSPLWTIHFFHKYYACFFRPVTTTLTATRCTWEGISYFREQ